MRDKGIIAVILALLVFVLAGLSYIVFMKKPSELQCTVDDSLSFTATGVTHVKQRGSQLVVVLDDNFPIHRNMLPGETCIRVDTIDWSLVR